MLKINFPQFSFAHYENKTANLICFFMHLHLSGKRLNNLSSESGDRLVKQDVCSYELRMEISLQEPLIWRSVEYYHIDFREFMFLHMYKLCKCVRNWPRPIGAFQDQYKQIVINEHN